MTIQDAIAAALMPFVEDAVAAAEKALPGLMPGLAGALLSEALSLGAVQAEIQKLEGKAVEEVILLLVKGLSGLKALILAHVHGKLGAWLQKELAQPLPQLNLTVSQVQAIAALLSQGKLDAALKAAGVL